ncbi:MAG TPA: 4-hydroxy-tetrahydrodipicolinate reductase [Elusimicrobiota bacterium]|nr:4-hydroxy-tetrahydrodipicolinate reductase [Elusimicrobiota bacterium]
MIRLGVAGAGGRMGTAILSWAVQDRAFSIGGLLERKGHPLVGHELHGVTVTDAADGMSASCDVLIDFTSLESTMRNAGAMAAAGKALVIGTTGVQGKDRDQLAKIVKDVPVVFSPNMSLGANILFDVAERLAGLLPGFDTEIVEFHHNRKKDSPSGTAQRLADGIARSRGAPTEFTYGREGLVGERRPSEIGVHAVRGGDVIGDHTVYFLGTGERIELSHRVGTRDAFALGALTAARWVVRQKPGLYDMRDVLGLASKK